jgi:acyl-CoA synthetase (AMP-forming)/AMP-acid ligase II
MIKVRGANVAPPQVEAVLESLPAVKHAFVLGVAHPEHELDQQVAAVVVAREGASIDRAALQAAAASELSGYKVPSLVVELDEASVPWLATGKPDKRALRAMIEGRRSRPG